MMLSPCFTVGVMCSGYCAVFVPHLAFCIQTKKLNFGLIWLEAHMSAVSSTCLLCFPHGLWKTANLNSYGFLSTMALFIYSPTKARFAEYTTNSYPVIKFSHLSCRSLQLLQSYHGLLLASLTNTYIAWPVSWGGQPCLGRFAVSIFGWWI